jgi:hypothetical protein
MDPKTHKATRTVKGLERNQERADWLVLRISYLAKRLFDRAWSARREAEAMAKAKPRSKQVAKQAAALITLANRLDARAQDLHGRCEGIRQASCRWGRSKGRIGVHDSYGWREPKPGEVPHAVQHGIRPR